MPIVVHSSLSGPDLHYPMGRGATPLDIPDATATAYSIVEDGASGNILSINTTDDIITVGSASREIDLSTYIARVRVRTGDPSAAADGVRIYSKDVSGTDQLFAIDDGGTVHQLTPTGGGSGGGSGLSNIADVTGGVAITSDTISFTATGFTVGGSRTSIGANAVGVGTGSIVSGAATVAVGHDASAVGVSGIAIGDGASSSNNYSIAVGAGCVASALEATAIGYLAASDQRGVAIGSRADTGSSNAVTIGFSALSTANTVCIGYDATCTGSNGIAIGVQALVNPAGTASIAIGRNTNVQHAESIAIGMNAQTTQANSLEIGSETEYITTANIGGSDASATARVLLVRTTNASGVDASGWGLTLQSGLGTGLGSPGLLTFRVGDLGTSGATLQSPIAAHEIDGANRIHARRNAIMQGGELTTIDRVSTSTAGGSIIYSLDLSSILSGDAEGIFHLSVVGNDGTNQLVRAYTAHISYASGSVSNVSESIVTNLDNGGTGSWSVTIGGSGATLSVEVATGSTEPCDWVAKAQLIIDDHA